MGGPFFVETLPAPLLANAIGWFVMAVEWTLSLVNPGACE
jgi:hypothetical protein